MTSEPDRTRSTLRWLTSIDLPARVLLACEHTPLGFVPADAAGVRVVGCLADAAIGLPAQLLAAGVPRVGVLPCGERPGEVAAQVAGWAQVLPDVAAAQPEEAPRRRLRRPASGPVHDQTAPQVSRRFAFGLAAATKLPFALTDEESQRVVASLRVLEEEGRARFAVDAPAPGGLQPEAAEEPGAEPAEPATAAEPALGPEDAGLAEPSAAEPASEPVAPDGSASAVPEDGEATASGEGLGGQEGPASPALALVAEGCVACGVCVRACPHDALELEHGPGVSVLTQVPERCTGERACVELCPHDALAASGPLALFDVARRPAIELAAVQTAACRRCGARHPAAEGELCPPCAFRSRNAFGHVPVR